MKKILILGFISFNFTELRAQTIVQGNVFNSKNEPVGFANAKLKESKKGASADSAGRYKLVTTEKGIGTIEPFANEAEEHIKKSLALVDQTAQKAELSEIYVGMNMLNRAGVFMNPVTYGREYGPKASHYNQLASQMNPDNPRALYMDGWEKYATPKTWGGDKVRAKQLLLSAKDKLAGKQPTGSMPHWGAREVNELLGKLD